MKRPHVARLGIQCLCAAAPLAVASQQEVELSLADLLNIEVTTASKTPESQAEAPGILTIVSRDELDRFGGTSLLEILNRVPGLSSGTNYFTDRSLVTSRGDQVKVTSGHVLLLIDGRPVREILEGGINTEILESFPIDVLERIEIIKGPGSVLYGSDAFSAVVNLITVDPEESRTKVSALAGPEGNNLLSGSTMMQSGDLRLVVAARRHQKPETDLTYLHKGRTGAVKALPVKEPNEGNGAFASLRYKDSRLSASFTDWRTWNNYDGIAINSNHWTKSWANAGHSLVVSDIWSMDLNLGVTASTMKTDTVPWAERFSYDAVAEWTNFIRPTEDLKIVAGGLLNHRKGEAWKIGPEEGINVDSSQFGMAAYTQMDYRFLEIAKVITGMQVNKFLDVDLDYAPRLGLILSPLPKVSAKVLYSEAYRAPSINELALNVPTVKGNPNLKPEKVKTIEGSLEWHGEQTQASVSAFRSEQENIIRSDLVAPGSTVRKYFNLDAYEIYGAEAEGKAYVSKAIFLNGSVLWQRSLDSKDSTGSLPTSEWTVKTGASYSGKEGIEVALSHIFQSDYGSDFSKVANPAPSGQQTLNLHASAEVFRLLGKPRDQELEVVVEVSNLLDETYWVPEWGGRPLNSLPGSTGRTVYGGLSLTF